MPTVTPFMQEMDGLRKKLHNVPDIDPRTYPRTKLQMLMQVVAATPRGFGGSAFLGPAAHHGVTVFSGAALVRAAMAVHRARFRERESKSTAPSQDDSEIAAVYHDEQCVVVPDKFPKSAFHFLVLPRDCKRLGSLNDLRGDTDQPLLRHMIGIGASLTSAIQESNCDADEISSAEFVEEHAALFTPGQMTEAEKLSTARRWAEVNQGSLFRRDIALHRELPEDLLMLPRTRVKFVKGFHALPSLPPLHMHVMSLDLLGPCLKNKKHYNSFTTNFFLSATNVENDLAVNGRVKLNQRYHEFEFLERKQMECVWCGLVCESIPKLRRHVPVCPKNMSRLQ